MRREDHVVQANQGIVGRQRLNLEDVQPSSRDLSIAERGRKRGLVDQFAASNIDAIGARTTKPSTQRKTLAIPRFSISKPGKKPLAVRESSSHPIKGMASLPRNLGQDRLENRRNAS